MNSTDLSLQTAIFFNQDERPAVFGDGGRWLLQSARTDLLPKADKSYNIMVNLFPCPAGDC